MSSFRSSSEHVVAPDRETDLCPNCMASNPQGTHFCNNCNAPLTSHAATDPIGSIAAAGHVYSKAASRPQSRLVLVGMWLLFAPLFILNLPAFWMSFQLLVSPLYKFGNISAAYYDLPSALGLFLLIGTIEATFILIMVKVTRNYVNRKAL